MVIRTDTTNINAIRGRKYSQLWLDVIGSTDLSLDQELAIIQELKLGWKKRHSLFSETKFWYYLRKEVLKRDNARCVQCGSDVQLHVDHITYPGHGNETIDDLQTLCYFCHAKKTTMVDMRARKPIKEKFVELHDDTQLFTAMRGNR